MALFSKAPDRPAVLRALSGVIDPASGKDLAAGDRIDGLVVRGGLVQLVLRTGREEQPAMERVALKAEAAIRALPGVANVTVTLTAHRGASAEASGQAATASAAPSHAPIKLGGTAPPGKLLA